jgi:hypothetical protein
LLVVAVAVTVGFERLVAVELADTELALALLVGTHLPSLNFFLQ